MNPAEERAVEEILTKGLCTREQVDQAIAIQHQMEEMGMRPRSVPEVLVEKGLLDVEDLEAIQRAEHSVEGREQIAGFKLLELLGRGGLGPVYKANQVSLDRVVALKVLDPELAGDGAYVERFLTEARAVARLSHTNLISGIDVGEDRGLYYLAMEYADGVTLRRILVRGGALDEERALQIGLQLARALEYAHKNALVHGDLRPENVMLTGDGVTKLCDLGVVKREVHDEEEEGALLGTPDYLSPEQARGLPNIGPAADLYALGCTLFHMVTGRPPYAAESREAVLARHLTEPVPSALQVAADLSTATDAVIQRCLQKNPAERPASAAELAVLLEESLATVQAGRGAAPAVTSSAAQKGARPGPSGGATPGGKPGAGDVPVARRRRRRR